MEFQDVVNTRRSIRKYNPDPVGEDSLKRILEAANSAPSAGNLQAFEIYLVQDQVRRMHLSKAALNQEFISEAPLVLVFCANPSRSEWKYRNRAVNLYSIQDATIACTFAMLAATNLGFASVWIGAFDENVVRQIIKAPADEKPVALLPIGYAAESSPQKQRRSLSELVHYL